MTPEKENGLRRLAQTECADAFRHLADIADHEALMVIARGFSDVIDGVLLRIRTPQQVYKFYQNRADNVGLKVTANESIAALQAIVERSRKKA